MLRVQTVVVSSLPSANGPKVQASGSAVSKPLANPTSGTMMRGVRLNKSSRISTRYP
jgi:hypothetical protein